MHKNLKNRLTLILLCLASLSLGTYMILKSMSDTITFFYTPSQIDKITSATKSIRVGGLVQKGSIVRLDDKCIIFTIEDYDASSLSAKFCGTLPLIFREGQGVILKGCITTEYVEKDNKQEYIFLAQELLAKHDEKYMPPSNYKSQK